MAIVKFVKMSLLFATAFAIFQSCAGFQYPDLVAMNATCPPKDTCRINGKGPRLDDPYNWKARNCFCDDMCSNYGDCCLDANAYVEAEQVENRDNYECVSLKQFGSLYMKGTCIPEWGDEGIAELCTKRPSKDHNDPMAEMPVTSLESHVTYKNYYCAICNNDSGDIEIWKPRLECISLKLYQRLYNNLTTEYVIDNLVYNNNEWGLFIEGNEGEVFHRCRVYPVMPRTVPDIVRSCKDMIKNCSADWTDEEVRNLCHSYTAVRYNFDQAYRNIHCAQCNDIELDRTYCLSQSYVRFINFGNEFHNQSFALLLDFSDRSGSNIVGSTSTCQLGEVFDPFFKKCRNVICGRSNQEYRFGRCIDIANITVTTESTTTSVLSSTVTTESTTTSVLSSTVTTESTTTSVLSSTMSPVANKTNSLSPLLDGRDGVVEVTGNVSSNSTDEIEENGVVDVTENVPSESTDEIEENGVVDVTENVPSESTVEINETVDTSTTPEPVVGLTSTPLPANEKDNVSAPPQALPCERFLLPTEEYTVGENGTVLVEKYERVYQISEYEQSEGGILVCIIQSDTEKFSRIMSWVTLGGLGLSCLCLLLHLIAFLVVPELRNLSGKNLASLCLVLLGAFSTFILSIFGEPGKRECFILAASMYYFFLSSFCWVNVMAFDVWRTLTLATTELRVSAGGQWYKFTIYTIYGWLFPAAAMAAVVVLDLIRPEFLPALYYPALGEYWCWFGHRKALLVFFAAPLMTIMILNIILFVLSARIIANTMESTAKMTTCAPYQSQFKLYMRLALLMGLTWISGIVAGYLQLEVIWYIFVILNTLQGFFIFLAFTCTRKVWHSVSCGCCRRMGRRSSSWGCRSPSSSKQGLQSTNSNVSNLSQTLHSPGSTLSSKAQFSAN